MFSLDFIQEYFIDFARKTRLRKARNFELFRAGNQNSDGGYLLLNDVEPGKIAYSFGICDDVTWNEDIANRGYQIFMYDMTINDLPKHRPEFHFFKEGIGREKDSEKHLDTLEHFIERNGHQNQRNMILKMDVEGAEWDFLETVKSETLDQFDQIIFEFHGLFHEFLGVPKQFNLEWIGKILSALEKLNQTHQLIHIHGHNGFPSMIYDDFYYPNLVEFTYASKSKYEFEDAEIILPHQLDRPIFPVYPELILGEWNARIK